MRSNRSVSTSTFQSLSTPGPTAARSAAVSTNSISSTSGEPTSTANRTTSCSSLVSRRNARCDITRCLCTRNFSVSVSRGDKPQPLGRLLGDPQAHLAVVLGEALAQVVNQQRQVQQPLLLDAAIDAPQRPAIGGEARVACSTARRQCSSTVYL